MKPWLDATTAERAYCAAGDYFMDHHEHSNREAFIANAIAEWERKRIIYDLRREAGKSNMIGFASIALMDFASRLEAVEYIEVPAPSPITAIDRVRGMVQIDGVWVRDVAVGPIRK